MNCLETCLKKVTNDVLTKCEEKLEDYILNYDNPLVLPDLELNRDSLVKTMGDSVDSGVSTLPPYAHISYYGSDIHLYYAVLAFPQNMNFKLKIKNKMKTAKYTNFTCAQQLVIFKRHINEWREMIDGKFIVIPEFCESGDLHFNIIYGSKQTSLKDMIITFTDAYGVNYAVKKLFAKITPVSDLERLITVYLKKKEGKAYQVTNMLFEYENL